jgi:hypothetical protein
VYKRTSRRSNRVLTIYRSVARESGRVYNPFPDYELTDPPGTGANTIRTIYRLARQMVAVQTKVGTSAGTYYYTYTDHLGNVMAHSGTGGAFVSGSTARYDPFGTFTTTPSTNPSITSQGFTGHRHNNTGTRDSVRLSGYKMPNAIDYASTDPIYPYQ